MNTASQIAEALKDFRPAAARATATATTTVNVMAAAAAPVAATTHPLGAISVARDTRRPTRVDSGAKARLDDAAQSLQRDSDARLALSGSAGSQEKHGAKLAAERAVYTKAYLVTEKGIDASRIAVYTGPDDAKQVTLVLIPTGASLETTGLTAVDENAVKAHPRTATTGKMH